MMGRLDAVLSYAKAQPKWFVYAIYGEWDRVAYVGATTHPERRYAQHQDTSSPWQRELRAWVSGNLHSFRVVQTCDSKRSMLDAEKALIKTISPQFNTHA